MIASEIQQLQERLIGIVPDWFGIREDPPNSNRGKRIDEIQAWFGMRGEQYCIMTALYLWHLALRDGQKKFPFMKTASTQTFLKWVREIKAFKTDPKLVSVGDIALWTKFTRKPGHLWTPSWQGHAELVISPCSADATFYTIGGNTSPDPGSHEREGGGIYKKLRNAKRFEAFPESGTYALVLRGIFDCETFLAAV